MWGLSIVTIFFFMTGLFWCMWSLAGTDDKNGGAWRWWEKLVSISYYYSCKGLYFDIFISQFLYLIRKKGVSYSWELVDSPIRLVNSVMLLEEFKLQKNCKQSCSSKKIWGIVKKTLGLVRGSYSLREWQALKLTFFAPCLLAFLTQFKIRVLYQSSHRKPGKSRN